MLSYRSTKPTIYINILDYVLRRQLLYTYIKQDRVDSEEAETSQI